VFGELIDLTDGRGDDSASVRWLLGEDLPGTPGGIRDMRNPSNFSDPDRTGSTLYRGNSVDSGGVHTNSGVNNKAAYLMTDGGTFNGETISGLGPAKVGAIYYTLEVAFLTSGSDYQDLYPGLPAACNTLAATRAHGITSADCTQVLKAVTATEMNVTPARAPLAQAPLCAAGQANQDIFYDNIENPALANWASSAEQGENQWYYPATPNPIVSDLKYTTSGKNSLWGNDQGGTEASPRTPADYSIAMTKSVRVPPKAFMHFQHAFDFELLSIPIAFDGGAVEYSTNGGATWQDAGPLFINNGYNTTVDLSSANPLSGRSVFSGLSRGYISSRLSLSSLAGQNVRFRFRIGTDEINPNDGPYYGWFIDDVRIYTCQQLSHVYLPLTQSGT
jgi:hypothetical protein